MALLTKKARKEASETIVHQYNPVKLQSREILVVKVLSGRLVDGMAWMQVDSTPSYLTRELQTAPLWSSMELPNEKSTKGLHAHHGEVEEMVVWAGVLGVGTTAAFRAFLRCDCITPILNDRSGGLEAGMTLLLGRGFLRDTTNTSRVFSIFNSRKQAYFVKHMSMIGPT
ncbi:hypothetical protein KCU92_g287, partial [Aureobasidium melanogenum]